MEIRIKSPERAGECLVEHGDAHIEEWLYGLSVPSYLLFLVDRSEQLPIARDVEPVVKASIRLASSALPTALTRRDAARRLAIRMPATIGPDSNASPKSSLSGQAVSLQAQLSRSAKSGKSPTAIES